MSLDEYEDLLQEVRPATYVCWIGQNSEAHGGTATTSSRPFRGDRHKRERDLARVIEEGCSNCRKCSAKFWRFIILRTCAAGNRERSRDGMRICRLTQAILAIKPRLRSDRISPTSCKAK